MPGGSPGWRAFTSTSLGEGGSDGRRASNDRLSERNSARQNESVAKKAGHRCARVHGWGHDSRPHDVRQRASRGDSEECRARCSKQRECNCLTSVLHSIDFVVMRVGREVVESLRKFASPSAVTETL